MRLSLSSVSCLLSLLGWQACGHLLKGAQKHAIEASELMHVVEEDVSPEPSSMGQVLLQEAEEDREESLFGTSHAQTFGAEIELSLWTVLADGISKGTKIWESNDQKAMIIAEPQGGSDRFGIENIIQPVKLNKGGRKDLETAVDHVARKNAQMAGEAAYMFKSEYTLREWIHRSEACRPKGTAKRVIDSVDDEDKQFLDMTWRQAVAASRNGNMAEEKRAKNVISKAQFFCTCRLEKGGMMKYNDAAFPIGPPFGMNKVGAGSGADTTNWSNARAYDFEAPEMIIGNPQVTAAVNIEAAGLSLWFHEDFDNVFNQRGAGSTPPAFPIELRNEIKTLATAGTDDFWQKKGADAYIGWLVYYVYAMGHAQSARESENCKLLNAKDTVLGFNVRTKFKETHEYIDSLEPTDKKLPAGGALFNYVWNVAKKGWQDELFPPKDNDKNPCDPAAYTLGGAVQESTITLKEMISALPEQDRFSEADPSLGQYPLQDTNGAKALIIEFRTPARPCGKNEDRKTPLTTITWWRDFLLRYFDFFKAFNKWQRSDDFKDKFAERENAPSFDNESRCSPRTWGFFGRGLWPRVCHAECAPPKNDKGEVTDENDLVCKVEPRAKFSDVG
uniref:Uncharacterized protein n=1 Tax=Chromera velia CCMP2878 TaxID=1169474 RepID=A0A0G4IBT3_9ALVE|eukprot:Cvel_12927.t1-p1 / transcript=Cvel_12927.t1 / gene=Cvel_12927 / organism=Chromera_velia_CCMP2878 / gene_product=hypothetical protein / transcript_product=hypothetical protein / location=Cvel_scaffold864:29182-31961(-) / protein_length=616 / sequence_SO=supercontig / SO=protein_coding / is_pseudo=false